MRLRAINEYFVVPANLYGANQLKGKTSGWSFLKYPTDRQKFIKWSSGKKKHAKS